MKNIVKRDGRTVPFTVDKIAVAIAKSFIATGELGNIDREEILRSEIVDGLLTGIIGVIDSTYPDPVNIEDIQNEVEKALMHGGYDSTAKAYILYRADRERERVKKSNLMMTLDQISTHDAKSSDLKRENANIDGDSAMGTMLKFGSESAKAYYNNFILPDEMRDAYENGDIHIHDFDFYNLTETCCQIDLSKLFTGGFSTGHGFLREPNHIASYAALAAIAIQSNQNDMHGGQSVPNFDRDMAPGVRKTFNKLFRARLIDIFESYVNVLPGERQDIIDNIDTELKALGNAPLSGGENYYTNLSRRLNKYWAYNVSHKVKTARIRAFNETEKATYQAMEGLVHNLNTMHSRAGAQVPFSSLNYGTDTSPEARMVVKNLLIATMSGLGMGETPIFPIQIFRLKRGINLDPGDPNYDLFRLSLECSSKRMFPNYAFQDAPYNLQFYDPERPETEIAYMGCRTRVIANVYDPSRAISYHRGNLSFSTVNLPRLAIRSTSVENFYELLDEKLELVAKQLLHRFSIQASKKVYNYPFLMGRKIWLDSDNLDNNDTLGDILRHGTLSVGFIGLAETLIQLTGKHHGEDPASQELGLAIITHMREFCDRKASELKFNFTLLATPAEGLSGRFVNMDRKRYGKIEGVTDKEYYTNSFHVPVTYGISIYDKISLEAPYHALTNAGHITYVETDGNLGNNIDAFESIVRHMSESGIGYGAVNHPLDRDPVCGYNGVIGDECPRCGRHESDDGIPFDRIRRITGYLVGTVERFNNAKRAEERDRVKHT